ncbi:MAG TPA: LptF/LptG family permease [Chitinophagaceae bacterium]|nr:LptF/LptG family permease [Chitinophagaceae bacterium]
MKKIDWYILRRFLSTFLFAILLFVIIAVVIDITEKLDDFVNNSLTFREIVLGYYVAFVPYITAMLFPLFTFLAVIYFTSKMAYQSEIIAIIGSGVSFNRYMRPYWVGGILLCLVLMAGNRSFIPWANRVRLLFEDTYVNNRTPTGPVSNIHLRIDPKTYVSIMSYDPTYRAGYDFILSRMKGQQLVYKFEAESVVWDTARKGWVTRHAAVHVINGLHEAIWLVHDTILKIPMLPSDLKPQQDAMEGMSTPVLNAHIAQQKLRGVQGINALYVEKYKRIAAPVAVVILTMIGAVIACRRIRGGSGLHIALGIAISSAYIVCMQFSYTFSTKGSLNPFIAVWLPNLIFGLIAWRLYVRAPK